MINKMFFCSFSLLIFDMIGIYNCDSDINLITCTMDKVRQNTTDIDRKLAIYYHPLFQQIIRNIIMLFNLPGNDSFEIGLLQFLEFNLKLQKSLLPSFQIENAIVSALNDWVKEVAECLNYEGMVSTSKCQQITHSNFSGLLQREVQGLCVEPLMAGAQYLKLLGRVANHDAFKLLGVRINKEVFNKFMFDLCSTWCEFLDIELFTYFMVAIYVQISQGSSLAKSQFRPTLSISTIDLQFMQEFEELKSIYSRTRKKELRYYRAWCEWNYLRINQIGQALILQLDQLHENDHRVLQLAMLFEKSIEVINEEITTQHPAKIELQPPITTQEKETQFLIAKKIGPEKTQNRQITKQNHRQATKETKLQYENEDEQVHNFQIEIDAEGNMYLKKILRLPVIGTRIIPQSGLSRELVRWRWIQRKREQVRQVSNLYRRMQNMKVRLQHNTKNDPYNFKEQPRIKERDEFYGNHQKVSNQYSNLPVQEIIHRKQQPQGQPQPSAATNTKKDYKELFKAELMEPKEPILQNHNYIHKTMAPRFLTDDQNNISYTQGGQGSIYGVGPYAQKRDLKLGLPRLNRIDQRIQQKQSYHLFGKLNRNRKEMNERVKSYSVADAQVSRIDKEKQEYRHVWRRYISEQEMKELNNYQEFYGRLLEAKLKFSKDYQSEYRLNLKQILIYENKRYQMGGALDRKQEVRFYERMAKLIKRDQKRQNKRKRRSKLRQYRKAVGGKDNKQLFEGIFLDYHRTAIHSIKQERQAAIKSLKEEQQGMTITK